MTYGPGSEHPQPYPPAGPQPPGGPGWGPPPPVGPQWTGSPPPPQGPQRKRPPRPLILILIGALVLGVVITVILLTAGGGDTRTGLTGSPLSTRPAPTAGSIAESAPTDSGGGKDNRGSRPLPPPTPTGKEYDDEPAVGDCVDIARSPNGLVLYQADCADPAASLILDNKQPQGQKCQDKGYWALRGFSGQILCFTYNVAQGDCVDLDIPRRAPCTSTPANGPKGKITITEIHRGEQDGTQCATPTQFLRVGKGNERGIACYTPITTSGGNGGSAPPIPSR